MMWPGRNSRENRSKESDTQFAKCNKLNEKCENEEESSASATTLTTKQRREQERAGWMEIERALRKPENVNENSRKFNNKNISIK